jgi:hypothetical protein
MYNAYLYFEVCLHAMLLCIAGACLCLQYFVVGHVWVGHRLLLFSYGCFVCFSVNRSLSFGPSFDDRQSGFNTCHMVVALT